jgi:DNA replication protein DnaC
MQTKLKECDDAVKAALTSFIALGTSGKGKTHVALALGVAACQKGYSVAFTTAAALVRELMEARDKRRLRALQKHLNTVKLLIVDELGYVPFTAVGSGLLFDVFSQCYERGSTLVTSNLPFDEWRKLSSRHKQASATPTKSRAQYSHKDNQPGRCRTEIEIATARIEPRFARLNARGSTTHKGSCSPFL